MWDSSAAGTENDDRRLNNLSSLNGQIEAAGTKCGSVFLMVSLFCRIKLHFTLSTDVHHVQHS